MEPGRIHVLDLGFEDAQRLRELAQRHPEKKFLGVEWTKGKGVQTRRHNLKLVWGDALNKLRRLPTGSVNVATMDFLLTEFKIKGHELHEFGWKQQALAPLFMDRRLKLLRELRRVLVPNGRLFINEYKGNLPCVTGLLNDAGFPHTVKTSPEGFKTKFLRLIRVTPITDPKDHFEYTPTLITARNRGPIQSPARRQLKSGRQGLEKA